MRRQLVACLAQNPTMGSCPGKQKQLLEILREVA